MNVKANKLIAELEEMEEVSVFPSCGDESNAFGAAYIAAHNHGENIERLNGLYLGTEYYNTNIEAAIDSSEFRDRIVIREYQDIEKKIAELLIEGKIVARFKGRMEFGARALGNRSILADPRHISVVRRINEEIKNRDFWMPYAPTILWENQNVYLINPKGIYSPFMMLAFDLRPEKRASLAASIHPYDFTTRPQMLKEDVNPDYYRLIKYFEESTGESAILNTSFNLHGYPLVESPQDALFVFMNSGLDFLALGDFLIQRIS